MMKIIFQVGSMHKCKYVHNLNIISKLAVPVVSRETFNIIPADLLCAIHGTGNKLTTFTVCRDNITSINLPIWEEYEQ
jgi:hypothetical protein